MNRLNRKIEYALMALKHMSTKRPGQLTSAKEVVEVTGGPFDATARVMQLMAQHGLLKSEHGAHGGYAIIKDLAKISFLELMELVLGSFEVVKCVHNPAACDLRDSCNVHSPMNLLNEKLLSFYQSVSIADLLQVNSPKSSVSPFGVEGAREGVS